MIVSITDYGAVCDGVTDDTAAIMDAHDNAPRGSTILVPGPSRFTSQLLFNRQVAWDCTGGWLMPDGLGDSVDAIVVQGDVARAGLASRFYVFNQEANSCRSVLVLMHPFGEQIDAWIAAGGAAYSMEVHGPLESDIRLLSSVNYQTPMGSPYLPPNHLKVAHSTTGTQTGANANRFRLQLAGQQNGVVITDMLANDQGTSTYSGAIQGIVGSPFQAVNCVNMRLDDLYVEGCGGALTLTGCAGTIIDYTRTFASAQLDLVGCTRTDVRWYRGGINIDGACRRTRLGNIFLGDGETVRDRAPDTEWLTAARKASTANVLEGGGSSAVTNLHPNGFVDIWPTSDSAPPLGFSGSSCTFARSTTAVSADPENPAANRVIVASSATTLAAACRVSMPESLFPVRDYDRWISFRFKVKVPSTETADLYFYVDYGSSNISGPAVDAKDSWEAVAFSVYVPAGATPEVVMIGVSGGYAAIDFEIGGFTWSEGDNACSRIAESPSRRDFVLSTTTNRPTFVGQRALVGGIFYTAKGTASTSDWM